MQHKTFWKSQIVTSKADKKGLRRNPYAFTEQGVAMLSGILNSDAAIDVNIKIMRAFVAIRRLTSLPYTVNRIEIIEKEIQRLKADFDDTLANQNDINEDTRAQLMPSVWRWPNCNLKNQQKRNESLLVLFGQKTNKQTIPRVGGMSFTYR